MFQYLNLKKVQACRKRKQKEGMGQIEPSQNVDEPYIIWEAADKSRNPRWPGAASYNRVRPLLPRAYGDSEGVLRDKIHKQRKTYSWQPLCLESKWKVLT